MEENKRYQNLILKHLTDELNTVEEKELFDWLKLDKKNQEIYTEIEGILKASDASFESYSPDSSSGWETVKRRIEASKEPKVKSIFREHWWKIAASVLLIIGLAWFKRGEQVLQESTIAEVIQNQEVAAGDTMLQLYLPDSSRIWLNRNSKIIFAEMFEDERKITLSGEAYFEVRRDTSKPFVVLAKNTITRVLGTSFSVRAYEEEEKVQVSVEEGKVEFASATAKGTKEKVILNQKEMVEFDLQKKEAVKSKSKGKRWWQKGFDKDLNRFIKKIGKDLNVKKSKNKQPDK